MRAELVDFHTGWYEVGLSLRPVEIDALISQLQLLQAHLTSHVQIAGDYHGEGGIGDVMFYLQTEGEDTMRLLGLPIMPNR